MFLIISIKTKNLEVYPIFFYRPIFGSFGTVPRGTVMKISVISAILNSADINFEPMRAIRAQPIIAMENSTSIPEYN